MTTTLKGFENLLYSVPDQSAADICLDLHILTIKLGSFQANYGLIQIPSLRAFRNFASFLLFISVEHKAKTTQRL